MEWVLGILIGLLGPPTFVVCVLIGLDIKKKWRQSHCKHEWDHWPGSKGFWYFPATRDYYHCRKCGLTKY